MSFLKNFYALPLNDRQKQSSHLRSKYPDRIPVIVDLGDQQSHLSLTQHKYLVPVYITLGEFIFIIRKRLTGLHSEDSFYLFAKNTMLPVSMLMSQIFARFADNSGFLCITVCGQETFG